MLPLPGGRQDNASVLYIGVQGIACTNIQAAAKWTRKNDLAFGGNLGLHGKTILPGFGGNLVSFVMQILTSRPDHDRASSTVGTR